MMTGLYWTGLDSAGTEHLWDEEELRIGAEIFNRFPLANHRDPNSPIYPALESSLPHHTWREDNGGEFRPIFRRANPWAKLGLVNGEAGSLDLTPLGRAFLAYQVNISEVLEIACSNYVEQDRYMQRELLRPYAIMADAFLQRLNSPLSVADFYFCINPYHNLGTDLSYAMTHGVSSSNVPPTAKRRIRSMLHHLVIAGAIREITTNTEWVARDTPILKRIAGLPNSRATTQEPTQVTSSTSITSWANRVYQLADEPRRFRIAAATSTDPEQKARLLERANELHANTVEALAKIILNMSETPYESTKSYDLYTEAQGIGRLFEIKSWTQANLSSQLKKAISQLDEYYFRQKLDFLANTERYIVLDRNPQGYLEDWIEEYIFDYHRMVLCWIEKGTVQTFPSRQTHLDWISY